MEDDDDALATEDDGEVETVDDVAAEDAATAADEADTAETGLVADVEAATDEDEPWS